ncbi:MAG: fibronectin type III domain-containing protein, partial [Bacteroidetes bacterium]|nr:fibronectin type III domain-containing protein [Bacteroidota bacterium]
MPGGSMVTAIAFDKTTTSTIMAGRTATMNIYLKNSSSTGLVTGSSWDAMIATASLAYSNSAVGDADVPAAAGFWSITLGTPFMYTGGALEVYISWDVNGASSGLTNGAFQWRYATTATSQAMGMSASAAIPGANSTWTTIPWRFNAQVTYTAAVPCNSTPTPGNTTGPASVCPGAPFILGLQNSTSGSGVSYQWESSADGNSWANAPGASTSASYSSTQAAATWYRCQVTCAGNGTAASTPLQLGMNPFLNCYCNSNFTNASFEFITNVNFSGINQSSGASAGGPVDYTANVATVSQGATSTLSVSFDSDGLDYLYAFIDWNQNGILNDGGEVYTLAANVGDGTVLTYTLPITVPMTALLGNTRMRVMVDYNNATPNPCRSATYGEAEDYTVNVFPPATCPSPTSLAVSNLTTSSANLSWTAASPAPANGYQWEVRSSGNPGDPGPDASGTTSAGVTTANAAGLAANTAYNLYVRSDCSGDFSLWVGPVNFKTLCNAAALPYTTNFEEVLMPPPCWSKNDVPALLQAVYSNPGDGIASGPSGNPTDSAGVRLLFYNISSGTATLTSNAFSPAPADYRVRFDVAGAAYPGSIDSVYLETSIDGGATWAILQAMSNEDGVGVLSTAPATTSGYIPSAANWATLAYNIPTGANMIRFRAVTGFGNYVYIDNVVVEPAPSCLPATALDASNVTGTSADLSWTASASNPADGYQWEVRSSGSPGSGATGLTDNGSTAAGITTASTSALTANTNYTLYVRSVCGVADTSAWASHAFFTGYCAATSSTSAYLIANFSTSGGFQNISNLNSGFSANGYGDFTTMTVSDSAGGTVNFSSDYGADTYEFTIWVDWNNDLDFDDAGEVAFTNTNYVSSNTGTITVPIGQAEGNYRMRIRTDWLNNPVPCGTGTYYGETEDYTFTVETPTCFAPAAVITSLAGGTATLTWTNNASESYNWELRSDALAPGSPGAVASGNVTTGPVSIPGLTNGSTYTFYIQGVCSAGLDLSSWAATTVYMGYCAAGATANAAILKIGRVAFSDVDNSSSSSAGYEDFTSVVGNVQAGASYPITIDIFQGYDADRVQIWIDANQDLVFTPDERVFIGYNPANPNPPMNYTITGNFYMSSAALGGTTRMRVRLDNTINGPNPDPCGNSTFGQVEDYT